MIWPHTGSQILETTITHGWNYSNGRSFLVSRQNNMD
nr:MAG TPA: hypothetical protein [Caudoviricetes sp.]